MNTDLLLDLLAHEGCLVGRTATNQLLIVGLPPHLRGWVLERHDELVLGVSGRGSGHRWSSCSTCGREQLVSSKHKCHLTPHCDGDVPARRKDPAVLGQNRTENGTVLPCARTGCDNPAHHLTAGHEPVCHLDWHLLALRQEYHQ